MHPCISPTAVAIGEPLKAFISNQKAANNWKSFLTSRGQFGRCHCGKMMFGSVTVRELESCQTGSFIQS